MSNSVNDSNADHLVHALHDSQTWYCTVGLSTIVMGISMLSNMVATGHICHSSGGYVVPVD